MSITSLGNGYPFNAKAMNFGKSRARMSSENDKKVTFADLEKVWEEVSITEDEENELIRKIRDEV